MQPPGIKWATAQPMPGAGFKRALSGVWLFNSSCQNAHRSLIHSGLKPFPCEF